VNRLVQEAVLVGLARKMSERGSWTGETHLQKAAYLLSELRNVDFGFDFILYKHGPFSFELRDELVEMRSDGLLRSFVQNPSYGPRLLPTKGGRELEGMLGSSKERYEESLAWIAATLGGRDVMELERLATAMWMTRKRGGSVHDRAQAVIEVKPHISYEAATSAVEEIDRLLEEQHPHS
jgi:uncharacterized protein YwgA